MKNTTRLALTHVALVGLVTTCLLVASPRQARAVECTNDAECPVCDVCVENQCLPTPGAPPMCEDESDCGEDEYCEIVPGAPCQNHCASKDCMVVFCAQECEPYSDPCADGKVCVETIKGCCGMCESGTGTCTTDDDCGACDLCMGGTCVGLPVAPECESDDHCGAEQHCLIAPDAPCQNRCASNECELVDCAAECTPFDDACAEGEHCVELILGCCGTCEPLEPGCETHADCDVCEGCHFGECIPAGIIECNTDADCDDEQFCQTYEGELSCKNHCVDQECNLIDCDSECDPFLTPCGDGEVCVEAFKGCCGTCEPAACQTDADCGDCQACVEGSCVGMGLVSCVDDADCPEDHHCEINEEVPCANQCVEDIIPTLCESDEDCGPCAVCHENECKATGMVICEADDDCAADEVCALHETDPCKNLCEPKGTEPDVVEPDASEPDTSAPDTAAPDANEADASEGDATPGGETPDPGNDDGGGTDCSFGGFQRDAAASGAWLLVFLVALSLMRRRGEA